MTKTNKALVVICRIARIMLSGITYTILGSLIAATFVVSILGFCMVGREGGYVAVFDFICSCLIFSTAVAGLCFLGIPRKRRGGKYVGQQ